MMRGPRVSIEIGKSPPSLSLRIAAGVAEALPILIILCCPVFSWGIPGSGSGAEKVRVAGKIVDQAGAAIPRASVHADTEEGKPAGTAVSNFQGEFTLELPEGDYLLTAVLPGFKPVRDHRIRASRGQAPVELKLEVPEIEEQIIVTATRTEAPLTQVGASATVITGSQLIQKGIFTLSDALRRVPGGVVAASGGTGSVASMFLRGGDSKYTKVLIDGIPVNEPGGNYNFANMSTTDIDRIEIVRGSQSALFGSDAISGVVQIFTRRGESEGLSPAVRLLLEGGSFASWRYAGGLSGKNRLLDYSVSFARSDTDNNVRNGSFNEETISGNIGMALSPGVDIRAVFRSEAGRTGVPGQWAFARPDPEEYYRRKDLAGGLTLTHRINSAWQQKLTYSVSDSRQFSADPVDSGPFQVRYGNITAPYLSYDFPYQTLNHTRRQKAGYQSDLALPGAHIFTAGFDFENETGVIGDPAYLPLNAERNNFGGYLQDQWSLADRFFTTAGVRLEHNDSFGFFAAPNLSTAYHLHQPTPGGFWGLTKIKGNFGMGIKEPTLIESYSQSPYFRGNPLLKPEKSVSFDFGLEQEIPGTGTRIELAWFSNHFRNQIGFVTTNYQTYEGTFFNLGKSRARGLETGIHQNLRKGFDLSASYTFLDSLVQENTSDYDPVFAKGQALLRRPRHSGMIDLQWRAGRWTLGSTAWLVGSRLDSDFAGLGLTRNPGYALVNLYLNCRLVGGLSWYAAGNNVLNKSYMEVLGYPALRAAFRIGIRMGL
jgi:vitamin B12 transporter